LQSGSLKCTNIKHKIHYNIINLAAFYEMIHVNKCDLSRLLKSKRLANSTTLMSSANDDRLVNDTTLVSPANDDRLVNGITLVSPDMKVLITTNFQVESIIGLRKMVGQSSQNLLKRQFIRFEARIFCLFNNLFCIRGFC